MKIGNYEIEEKIVSSASKTIYRVKDDLGQSYILKQLNLDPNHGEEHKKLKKEMHILEQLDPRFVVKCIEIGEYEGSPFLLMEDKGGLSLKSYLMNRTLNIPEFMSAAIAMAEALNHVHIYNVIHEDVNPSNFIILPETHEIWLNDFGLSEYYQKHSRYSATQTALKGTIEYISPEQTGRINASIDFRTDIYSLGVTFYEMCTGVLPFNGNDFLTNIHLHITVVPARPDHISPLVPRQIGNIIMKMLSKEPINRYQSLFGLLDDLKECQKMYQVNGFIQEFELASTDRYSYFNYPSRIYGRQNLVLELNQLVRKNTFASPQFLLVEGEPGIGKSYMVKELLKLQRNCQLLTGQFSSGAETPYSGIVEAIRYYFAQQLLCSDEEIARFAEELKVFIGVESSILMTLIPELQMFLKDALVSDEQVDVGYQETKFRFHIQMTSLIRFVLTRDEKLILILDNFQDVDNASVSLLEYLLERADLSNFVVIGLTQPLKEQGNLDRFRQKCQEDLNYKKVTLNGYEVADIQELLFDLFAFDESQGQVLADLVMAKTRGIPLFVYDLLKDFYMQNIIYFDIEMAKWNFHLLGVKQFGTSQNVVDHVLKRFSVLNDLHKKTLLSASCFEIPFSLKLLSQVENLSEDDLIDALIILVDNEFLEYDGRLNDLIFKSAGYDTQTFEFCHANIRSVVNGLLDADQEKTCKYKIGLELYAQYRQNDGHDAMPIVVKYFNQTKSLIQDKQLILEIVEFNFLLSYQARSAAAFEQAQYYISHAVQFLDERAFEDNYDLAFRVFLLKAEIEYLTRLFKRASADFDYLLKKANSIFDTAKVNKLRLVLYVNQGETDKVIDLAIETLHILGVELKAEGSLISITRNIVMIKMNRTFNDIRALEHLPDCTEIRILLIMEILMILVSVSYLISKVLFIQIILKMIELSLKHGNVAYSSFAYATYGILEGNVFGHYHRAYLYGELGIRLAKHYKKLDVLSQTNFTMGFFLNHWENHIREALPFVSVGRTQSEKCGDMVYFAYNVAAYHLANAASSVQLETILEAIDQDLKKINEVQVFDVTNLLISVRQMVLNLKGKTTHYTRFDSPGFDQHFFELTLKESKMPSIFAVYLVLKLKTHYIYDHYQEATQIFEEGDRLFSNLMGLFQSVEYLFYQALMLLKLGTSDARVYRNLRKLKKYAQISPTNFEHMYLILKGERLRSLRQFDEAKHYFEQALKVCHQNDFLLEEALCCEMIAQIHGQEANVKLRKLFLFEAYGLYARIGASARMAYMESKYKEIVFATGEGVHRTSGSTFASTSIKTSIEKFDLLGIIQASQSIAGVVNESELIDETLKIIMQVSNADRAVLMIKEEQLMVRAVVEGLSKMQVFQREMVKGSGLVPETLINYTLRMEEPLVVNHLETSVAYGKDPYFTKGYAKSVLAMPLLNKDRLIGLVYLENSLITGAFGYNRLESLGVILSQFAISFENARLIESIEKSENQIRFHKEHLEELVSQRTSELSIAKSDIEDIMNNVDQGFMQFDQTGIVLDGYSKECIKIFGRRIDGMDFDSLFNHGAKKNEDGFYKKIIKRIFEVDNAFSASVYLGLLPDRITHHMRTIQVSYKLVHNRYYNRIVVIMTDITDKMRLEAEKEAEKNNLKKIVNIIKYRSNLKKNVEEYKQFFITGVRGILAHHQQASDSLKELYRIVHTFKGDFGQWGMEYLSTAMHALEENMIQLSQREGFDDESILELMDNFDFEEALNVEFGTVIEYTGKAFLEHEDSFQVSKGQLETFSLELLPELTQDGKKKLQDFVKHIQYVEAKDMLLQYQAYVISQADHLNKQLSGILVNGDTILLDRDIYYDFFRSLIHIMRNIVQYAIEPPDVRMSIGKAEAALITCDMHYTDKGFNLVIADDGSGIDLEKVEDQALALKLLEEDNYTEQELMQVIFLHGFTTSDHATMLAGRGIGLSAVKDEAEKLGGSVKVRSTVNEGTQFEFDIPLKHQFHFK